MLLGGSLGTYHRQHAFGPWGMVAGTYDLPASQQAAQQRLAHLARLGQPILLHQTVRNVDAPACMKSTHSSYIVKLAVQGASS